MRRNSNSILPAQAIVDARVVDHCECDPTPCTPSHEWEGGERKLAPAGELPLSIY